MFQLKYKIFLICLFFVQFPDINAQNRAYCEKLKSNKKQSIEYSKKLLSELKSTNENNLDKLLITREQINKQKDVLNIINKELSLIDEEVKTNEAFINQLKEDQISIKEEYSKLIQFSYKNLDLQKRMIFIFSASSFNKAYKRMLYLKNLSDYRKSRFLKIDENIREQDSVINLLKENKKSKLLLQNEKLGMIDSLDNRRKQLNVYINQNRTEINKIAANIEVENVKKEATKENVTKQITFQEENKPKINPKKSVKLESNKGSSFESKKNWHIWPLSKFVILHHYGDYYHPVLENIVVKNDGVELGAAPGSNVHSVFEGIVINIINIPGDGSSIIIKHGNYYSVYTKLYQVLVQQDDVVTKGQVVAKLAKNDKVVKMNFQLWKGKEKLNPELWLKRQ